MARPVFSSSFITQQGLSGTSSPVVVPAGHVYVVKQLTWFSNPLLAPSRGYFMDVNTNATLFSCGTNAGTPAWFGFYGAITFEAGRAFVWRFTGAPGDAADVYAGGYDLLNE